MLVHLLYASRAGAAIDPGTIESILQASRARNPALGITGVLCHAGDVFMQLLEGGRAPVNELYNAIVRDPRHREVMLLHYREVPERSFGGWTMGQVRLDRINPSLLLKYSETPKFDPFSAPGEASMALLGELVATAQVVGRAG